MEGSLNRFGDLMGDPQIFTDAWMIDVAVELVTWDSTYDEAMAITPPSRFAEFHAVYVEALGNVSEAGDLFAQGIDNFDPELINQAAEKLNRGTVLLEEAARMLNELS